MTLLLLYNQSASDIFTRGNYASLPADDADLETVYSSSDITDVGIHNSSFVNQTGTTQFMIHQYKKDAGSNTRCTVTSILQTDLLPSSSTVYLQIYNRDSTSWETIDSDNTSAINTDITLTYYISDLTNYKDGSNIIAIRLYQQSL